MSHPGEGWIWSIICKFYFVGQKYTWTAVLKLHVFKQNILIVKRIVNCHVPIIRIRINIWDNKTHDLHLSALVSCVRDVDILEVYIVEIHD